MDIGAASTDAAMTNAQSTRTTTRAAGQPPITSTKVAHKMRRSKPARRREERAIASGFTQWLLENQIGCSLNLAALLFLSHLCIPAARPYTTKFFTLSYYNAESGKYAAGYDDFCFMAFCIVLLTGLRAGMMDYVLAPLASRWGVSTKKDATRFAEQGWMLMYYSVFWPMGMHLYTNSKYYLRMEELWTDWPERHTSGLMKAYILGQWSFWIQQVLVINMEARRKDHWQMLTHHVVTIALVAGSYAYHQTRVANLVLILMDVNDLFLPLAKCLKYLGFTTICDVFFGGFIVSWIVARHIFYNMTLWSVFADLPRKIPGACYHGPATNLEGPLPIPEHGWSHLLEPFYKPTGTVCFSENIMYPFLLFLGFLQVMMIMWFMVIVQIVIRMLQGKRAEDLRSNSEAEDTEEEEEMENDSDDASQVEYLEKECDAEGIDWKGRERRAGATKMNASSSASSSVNFPGHRDRKELLNRIGCEKQIE